MKFRPVLLAFLCISTLVTNAQTATDNPLFRHIPADAEKIYHINYTALNSKIDWKVLGSTAPQNENNAWFVSLISNPGAAGIDVHPGFVVSESNILAPDSPRYTTVILALSDSVKFLQMFRAKDKGNYTIVPGKIRTAREGFRTVYCWNDKWMVSIFVKAPKNKTVTGDAERRYYQAALRKCQAAFNGSGATPFMTNPEFIKGFSDDADMQLWNQYGSGFGAMSDAMRMAKAPVHKNFITMAERMKHSHSHNLGTVRFDNGLISFRSRTFYDSTFNGDLPQRPLNTDLIDRLPQGNLLGLAALHFDLAAWLNMAQTQSKGKIVHTFDSLLAKKGLTTKDLLAAFKGDLVFAVIDSGKPIPATDTTPVKPGKPNVFVVVPVNDVAAFAKVATVLQKKDTAASKKQLAHVFRNNTLVLASSQQAANDYFDKTGRGPSRLVSDELRAAPLAVAVDIKAINTWLQPMFGENAPAKTKQMQVLLSLFDQLIFTTGKTHGHELETLFEIKMANTEQNSLVTIMQLLKSMSGK
jgi:hypothetical protein